MKEKIYDIGVLGLGVMGASLAKNMISHGFAATLFSISGQERAEFEYDGGTFCVCDSPEDFVVGLKSPRKIFMMITAGKPVDLVIGQLLPLLDKGDVIMDGGNSYYKDTERRCKDCGENGIHYLGIGVSGGELGALNGPSIMAGGDHNGYHAVTEILQTIAAQHNGKPCCNYIGKGGAGHYVKMVHNGIEYAILELMAETYQFMRFMMGMTPKEIRNTFLKWNNGKLNSYLTEISALVLGKYDEDGSLLIDKILDIAEQKGTGKWTVTEGIERGVYIPTIYEAQAARVFSTRKNERVMGAERLACHPLSVIGIKIDELEEALLLAVIIAYSQGLELIAKASEEEMWNVSFSDLAGVWEAGCIIRSRLLEEIEAVPILKELPLILSDEFSYINELEASLRKVAALGMASGQPVPAFGSAMNYYDYYRTRQMPVNFIQALRDCFGAHTYMRTDKEGHFHTKWEV